MRKLANRLASWKLKALSLAGRTVLIKTVAMAIPSYTMQTTLLPSGLCVMLDGMIH